MKKFFVFAIMMMACVCGCFAQESVSSEEVASEGIELATTADGKKVQMWDLKIDGESGDVSFVVSLTDAKAGELWSWCRMWLAENVKEYNRIKQIEDKQEGRLVVNYTAGLNLHGESKGYESKWLGWQTWKMTIQCKDERFRVRMTEYKSEWDVQGMIMGSWSPALEQINSSMPMAAERMGAELFMKQYQEVISGVIASMGEYLKKMCEEDDDF